MEKGIVLYNIESDGCLNGVYTNNNVDGEIYNEIAKLHSTLGRDDLGGVYYSTYFDIGSSSNKIVRKEAELTIDIADKKKKTYAFSWKINGKIVYSGIGYRMNEKQIAVYYWDKE